MKYVVIFILAILLFYTKSKYDNKIDDEEKKDLQKDGNARFIRTNYPNLVEKIISITGWSIFKERDDAVLIGDKDTEYIALNQHSGMLKIVYVRNSQVIQQWNFTTSYSSYDIISQIKLYF